MQVFQWRNACATALLLVGGAAIALAADPVTNTLSVQRIAAETGRETTAPASSAKPGDLLEYVAEFRNTGTGTARGLSATLPLPPGTEFVARSQQPAGALGSIDGVRFEPLPLRRTVRNADGSSREELVPAADYRFLRWPPAELPAGGTLRVSARVAVSATR